MLQKHIDKFYRQAEASNEYSAFARYIVDSRYSTVAKVVDELLARVATKNPVGAEAH
ncbi:hypothetical protein D3C85_1741970 [compost metagenome]